MKNARRFASKLALMVASATLALLAVAIMVLACTDGATTMSSQRGAATKVAIPGWAQVASRRQVFPARVRSVS